MPLENKYEIRSREVQEVLSSPPRFLTVWGNVLVISVLVIGLVFLGRYKVMRTIKVPVRITEINGKVGLIVDSAFAEQIKVNQQLKLQIKRGTFINESIVETFDTTINMSRKKCLVFAAHYLNQFAEKSASNQGINSEAEIQIGEASLLQLFVSK